MFGMHLGLFGRFCFLGLFGRLLSTSGFIVFEGVNDFVEGRMVKIRGVCCYLFVLAIYFHYSP